MADHELHLGDCLAGLRALPDAGVDHFIMDPPYSEHTHAKVRRGGSVHAPDVTTGGPKRPVISSSVVLGFDALAADLRAAVAVEIARLVRRWVVIFSDAESVHLWQRDLEAAGLEHVRVGAWVKEGASPQFTGDRPGIGYEAIEIAHPAGRKRWNGGGRHGLWSFPIASGDRIHTTQKPLDLMEALVRDFTEPDDLVCDPFAGSASTLVACKRLGRRAIGWEQRAEAYEPAARRLAETKMWWCAPGKTKREKGARPPEQQGLALVDVDGAEGSR